MKHSLFPANPALKFHHPKTDTLNVSVLQNINQLRASLYLKRTVRICVSAADLEKFPHSTLLANSLKETALPVELDSQSILRATSRNLEVLYQPLTGHFSLLLKEQKAVWGRFQELEDGQSEIFVQLEAGDEIHGFGAALGEGEPNQTFELLNYRNDDTKGGDYQLFSFPFFTLQRGDKFAGVFLNCSYPMSVRIHRDQTHPEGPGIEILVKHGEEEYSPDIFIISGTPAFILQQYVSLTGRNVLPPLWALGLHISNNAGNESQLKQLGQSSRTANLPGDSLVLPLGFTDNLSNFTWHPRRFPEPKKMNSDLKTEGWQTIAAVSPLVKIEDGFKTYEQGKNADYYCKNPDGNPFRAVLSKGEAMLPDFSRLSVRRWWGACHNDLLKQGVSAVWNTCNEPLLNSRRNYDPFHEQPIHESGPHRRIRNMYAGLQARGTRNGLREVNPDLRPFILSDAGFSGIQKLAALRLARDAGDKSGPSRTLQEIINLGLSGAGGILLALRCEIKSALNIFTSTDRHLMERWIELASLMPFYELDFSSGHTIQDFPEPIQAAILKYTRRRYRLLPYLYGLFWELSSRGAPIIRSMAYEFPEIKETLEAKVENQFMLGPSIMAAPVLNEKIKTRRVFFPPGDWYDFESGRKLQGNRVHDFHLKNGYSSLFIKAGTILPLAQVETNTERSFKSGLHLEMYPHDEMFGRLILDDFNSIKVFSGSFLRMDFTAHMERTGDLVLAYKREHDEFEPEVDQVTLRLPVNYKFMIQGEKKQEGELINLQSEDRSRDMYSFVVELKDGTARFPFRPHWTYE